MRIVCIGGGPAGLYFSLLMKKSFPQVDIEVFEKNKPDDTFGWGVVFSQGDARQLPRGRPREPRRHRGALRLLGRHRDHRARARRRVSTGHGFCGLARKELLAAPPARAATQLGVKLTFQQELPGRAAARRRPHHRLRRRAQPAARALRRRLQARTSTGASASSPGSAPPSRCAPSPSSSRRRRTASSRCTPTRSPRSRCSPRARARPSSSSATRRSGRRPASTPRPRRETVAFLRGRSSRTSSTGTRCCPNKSIWRTFPTIRCERWRRGNLVLLGDAVHTAHFSIGSGTKLAMEDAIALHDALQRQRPDRCEQSLAAYETRAQARDHPGAARRADQPRVVRELGALRAASRRCSSPST